MIKIWNGRIPYRMINDGTAVEYLSYFNSWKTDDGNTIENCVFQDILMLDDYSKGRSAVNFHWADLQGNKFTMFLSDFFNLVKGHHYKEETNAVTGWWTFRKQGSNIGVVYLSLDEPEWELKK